jgi:hypothetical protein
VSSAEKNFKRANERFEAALSLWSNCPPENKQWLHERLLDLNEACLEAKAALRKSKKPSTETADTSS